jgi:hypothetical protein
MLRTIKVSAEVWAAIAERGKFGETEDDVLRRVFELPGDHQASQSVRPGRTGRGGKRNATKRMSCRVNGANQLIIEFEGSSPNTITLPQSKLDKDAINQARATAHDYARAQGASQGQIDAITKAMNEAGYYTQHRRRGRD